MRRWILGSIAGWLLFAALAVAQPAPPRAGSKARLAPSPAVLEKLEALARAKRTPLVRSPPAPEREELEAHGIAHSVSDGRVLLAVAVGEETLGEMPWIRRVMRLEDVRDGTSFEGRLFVGYDLSLEALSLRWLDSAEGTPVVLTLVRDGYGNPKVLRVRSEP